MRRKLPLVSKILAAAALATVILVPSAAGSTSARVKLALIPLPKSVIGSVAKPLQLSHFSGVVSNAAAAAKSVDGTTDTFNNLGRLSGYELEYGVAASGRSGVTQVLTGVEKYKTATAAKRGLAFWKKDDSLLKRLNQGSFSVKNAIVTKPGWMMVRAFGQAWFASLTYYSAPNIADLLTFDQRFREGKYVLQVHVSAGPDYEVIRLANRLGMKLDARLKLALKGRLHAKPVKLPPALQKAPSKDGPELSQLALNTSDLSGQATLQAQGYVRDPGALSCYSVTMMPAGPFFILWHDTEWYATANQAAFEADWQHALHLSYEGSTAIDLSSVGHSALGGVGLSGDQTHRYAGEFDLNVGRLAEFVVVVKDTPVQASDMQNLAQTLANRLDPVYTGK
jgi:hypothetical protein